MTNSGISSSASAHVRAWWTRFKAIFNFRSEDSTLTLLSFRQSNENWGGNPDARQISRATSTCRPGSEPLHLDKMNSELAGFIASEQRRGNEESSEKARVSTGLYYLAAWTDGGCLLGCDHTHGTVISAANCISEPAGYVVAVKNGRLRALSEEEEQLFQLAMYGASISSRHWVVFKPLKIPKTFSN